MTCREFQDVAAEVARERGVAASVRALALAHAEDCTGCAARLADERNVSDGLRLLAAANAERGASPGVEAFLRASFAAPRPQKTARTKLWWWAVPAAASVVFAIVFVRTKMDVPAPPPVPHFAVVQTAAPPVAKVPEVRKVVRRRTRRTAPPQTEVATRFYRLRAEDENAAISGPVVRVQVSRSTLLSLGLPVNPERVWEPAQADVVLDDTGAARAIRLISLQ